tara:strand:+ start:66 stop:1049 length:984 start_codon:yes stop_codon:yes gene_type:complete
MFNLIGFKKQNEIILNNYISNNLHSSVLIYGPKGIGKRTFINKFINDLLIKIFDENSYLHHLNLFKNNTHPNIKILEKVTDQKTKKLKSHITIDQIRQTKKFLNESSSVKKIKKILIIDSADDLNINAANSFLKILEEPKKNTLIFLISHQISSLIPTIRSRCLKIKFNKHEFVDFKEILSNKALNLNDEEIKFYYDLTFGSPGDAITLFNSNIIDCFDTTIQSMCLKSFSKENTDLASILSKFNNDEFKLYISLLKSILVFLNKLKNNDINKNVYLSNKFELLKNYSNSVTKKNIIDRFNYLSKNENDLFTYNLDKKMFILKFLNI